MLNSTSAQAILEIVIFKTDRSNETVPVVGKAIGMQL